MKNLPRFLFLCITFFLFPFAVAAQPAREQIERFDVSASVNVDSSVDITERITVRAAGDKIRRGIFRVLPYKGVSGYEILSVQRDGRPEPYSVESSSSGKTVYIGDKNRILAPGLYGYEIAYRVSGAVRFQKQFDEFYWNVTGNEWQFPIQSASLRLTLPHGAKIVQDGISLYTGYAGQSGPASARARGESFFFTARPLNAGEGLTVSAAWNKGIVQKPKDRVIVWLIAGWLLLLIYYVIVWYRIGRDPAARVIRQFEPPKDLSPAQVRYLYQMKADARLFCVVILSLVQKGYVRVTENDSGDFVLVRTESALRSPLAAEEKAAMDGLFESCSQIKVNRENTNIFQTADAFVCNALEIWAKKRFFSRHAWFNVPTFLFGIMLFIYLFSLTDQSRFLSNTIVVLAVFIPIIANILHQVLKEYFPRLSAVIPWAGLSVFLFLLLEPKYALVELAALVPGIIFYYLVPAYTALGRRYMDEIEGFLQYLKVAEKYRVFASDPTDASRIYCSYLPYAVALDVQNKWQQAFQNELGEAFAEEAARAQGFGFDVLSLASGLVSASISVSSSSSDSSSSGFGGGGCSGGGSGGGGGGGW